MFSILARMGRRKAKIAYPLKKKKPETLRFRAFLRIESVKLTLGELRRTSCGFETVLSLPATRKPLVLQDFLSVILILTSNLTSKTAPIVFQRALLIEIAKRLVYFSRYFFRFIVCQVRINIKRDFGALMTSQILYSLYIYPSQQKVGNVSVS